MVSSRLLPLVAVMVSLACAEVEDSVGGEHALWRWWCTVVARNDRQCRCSTASPRHSESRCRWHLPPSPSRVVVATPSAVTEVGLAATTTSPPRLRRSALNTTGVLVPVLPAASVSLATILWLPLPDSVTLALQLPSLATVAVPSGVALPLSNSVTVVPASATAD